MIDRGSVEVWGMAKRQSVWMLLVFSVWLVTNSAEVRGQSVERWGIHEVSLVGPASGNPFVESELSATFSNGEHTLVVKGFYDGEGNYRIRFSPPQVGTWKYTTSSNRTELANRTGEVTVGQPVGYNHGPVHVHQQFHFAYADGKPFYPLGTTCYAWTHQTDALIEETLAALKASPFNKVRMCVFPKNYAYNSGEALRFPFMGNPPKDWDWSRFNPEYFQHLDRCVERLMALGIEADLILFHPYDKGRWGFDRMAAEVDDRYLRYMIARYSAYRNVWWSLANEYDFMLEKQPGDWDRFLSIVAQEDPHTRLRSIHNGKLLYNQTKPELTHASIQNGSAVADFGRAILFRDVYRKPIVFDEVKYEGDIEQRWGSLSAEEMVHRCWQAIIGGTYVTHGETYNHPDNVIWWAKGGILRGQSPARIAFLKRILEESPHPLEPIDKWQNDRTLGVKGKYYLMYMGKEQPKDWEVILPRDGHEGELRLRAELIDTWNMSVTPVEGHFDLVPQGKYLYRCPTRPKLTMPGKPFMLIRFRAIEKMPESRAMAVVDPEYRRVAEERALKIVQSMKLPDPSKLSRVQDCIAQQYCDLKVIHAGRDAAIRIAKEQYAGDKAWSESLSATAKAQAESEQFKLHYAFLARLATELNADQIEQVKDGMTYHVAPKTLQAYQKLHPHMTPEQQQRIQAWLLEAREFAMDAGSSEEKHAWFGKYKGRINNYLSAAGYNAKAAEKALEEKRQQD